MDTHDDSEIQNIQCSLERVLATKRVDLSELQRASISTSYDPWSDGIVIWLTAQIAAWRGKQEVHICYPATWWDAVKNRWAPAWWLRRWPVVWHREDYHAAMMLPDFPLPPQGVATRCFPTLLPMEDE